jgi:hypothetical protein
VRNAILLAGLAPHLALLAAVAAVFVNPEEQIRLIRLCGPEAEQQACPARRLVALITDDQPLTARKHQAHLQAIPKGDRGSKAAET